MSEVSFEEVRKGQVAATRPPLFCVVKCFWEKDILNYEIVSCFFSMPEAEAALEWLVANAPLEASHGHYEISDSKLSQVKL